VRGWVGEGVWEKVCEQGVCAGVRCVGGVQRVRASTKSGDAGARLDARTANEEGNVHIRFVGVLLGAADAPLA
jgi:hypothetical protein